MEAINKSAGEDPQEMIYGLQEMLENEQKACS